MEKHGSITRHKQENAEGNCGGLLGIHQPANMTGGHLKETKLIFHLSFGIYQLPFGDGSMGFHMRNDNW